MTDSFVMLSAETNVDPVTTMFGGVVEVNGAENVQRAFQMRTILRQSPYQLRETRGSYSGIVESSFQVIKPGATAPEEFIAEHVELASAYSQDSVLYVDGVTKVATAHYPDGDAPDKIGVWQEVSEDEAALYSGWTFIDGRFFAALPEEYTRPGGERDEVLAKLASEKGEVQ